MATRKGIVSATLKNSHGFFFIEFPTPFTPPPTRLNPGERMFREPCAAILPGFAPAASASSDPFAASLPALPPRLPTLLTPEIADLNPLPIAPKNSSCRSSPVLSNVTMTRVATMANTVNILN